MFPGRASVIRETYTQYANNEEQEQKAEPGACVSTFSAGENVTIESLDDGTFW